MKKEMNNKGVSTIIVTVIMITIVLAAVGVVWVIVQNVLESGEGNIDLGAKCLEVNLQATKMDCDATNCDVTINRKSGGDIFGGVKLIFSNSVSGNVGSVGDASGNIEVLGTTTIQDVAHGLTGEQPDSVEIVVYFLDENSDEKLCSQGKKFKF